MKYQSVIFSILCLSFTPWVHAAVIWLPTLNVSSLHSKKIAYPAETVGVSYDRDNIQQQGVTSVTQLLQRQAIVQVRSSSSNQSKTMIAMRGFGENAASNTLLQIEGIPITSFTDTGPSLDSVLVQNIDSIDIQTGSFGALYGNHAVAGVVNMKIHRPVHPISDVVLGLGNMGQRQVGLYFSRRLNHAFAYNIGAKVANNDHAFLHNEQQNTNFNADLFFYRSRYVGALHLLSYRTQIQIPNPYIWGGPPPSTVPTSEYHQKGSVLLFTNKYLFKHHLIGHSDVAAYQDGMQTSMFSSRMHEDGLLWQNSVDYKKNLQTGIRMQYNRYRMESTVLNEKAHAYTLSAFNQFNIPINKRLHLLLGVRYATQGLSTDNIGFDPILQHHGVWVHEEGLRFDLSSKLKWYLRHDTNFRFVNAKEALWTSGDARQVNPLKMQTGNSWESGLKWHYHRHRFSLGLYRLALKNELAYTIFPLPFGQMTNLPPTIRTGATAVAHIKINPNNDLDLQLDGVDPRIRSGQYKGKVIPAVSSFNASIGWNHAFATGWRLQLLESLHSSFYAQADLLNVGARMPAYALTDVFLQKRMRFFDLGLQLNNLFNQRYVRYADYSPALPLFGLPSMIRYYPNDGRSIMLTINVHLGGGGANASP